MPGTFAALTLICMLAAGCSGLAASSGLSEEQESQIPENANTIVALSALSPDTLYARAQRALLADGYAIHESSDVYRTIKTEGKRIGQRLIMRMQMQIVVQGREARLVAAGGWIRETTTDALNTALSGVQAMDEEGRPAAWTTGASRYAFAQMRLFIESLPHREISYEIR